MASEEFEERYARERLAERKRHAEIIEMFGRKLNEYRGLYGRDSTRPREIAGWDGRFGHDLDSLDGALQQLRDHYGRDWMSQMLEAIEDGP